MIISPIVKSNPDNEYYLNTMAFTLYNLGRYYEAQEYFNKGLKLNPNMKELLGEKESIAFNNLMNQKVSEQVSTKLNDSSSDRESIETTIANEKKEPSSIADELLKLSDSKDKGIITEEEFTQLKQNILNSDG